MALIDFSLKKGARQWQTACLSLALATSMAFLAAGTASSEAPSAETAEPSTAAEGEAVSEPEESKTE